MTTQPTTQPNAQPNAQPDAQLDAMLQLSLASGLGPILTRRVLDHTGSPIAAVQANIATLRQIPGIGPDKALTIRQGLDEVLAGDALEKEKTMMAQLDARAVFLGQDGYPKLLSLIPDPPVVLYVRGELDPADGLTLGVVGSRKCTAYGREQADRLSAWCAQAGLTIVSGGAYGVDAAAHRAAMRAGGKTIIVLGSGLARPYPSDHVELFDQAAKTGSAVVSELPMSSSPRAEHFPRRNRIISGLSLGVLVIEAAVRSGALITARLAAEDHAREVLALPGRVDSPASAGCHKILREGWASLVTTGPEILDSLGEAGQMLQASRERSGLQQSESKSEASSPSLFEQNLTDDQRKILTALDQPLELNALAGRTGLIVARLQADLTILQIRGLVTRQGGAIARVPNR